MHELDLAVQIIAILLLAGTALVAGLRVRPLAPALLAAIGFGLNAISPMIWLAIDRGLVEPHREILGVLWAPRLLGLASVFVAFLVLPSRTQDPLAPLPELEALPPSDAPPPLPAPGLLPTWGLPVTWIVLSAFAWIGGGILIVVLLDAGSSINRAEEEAILACTLATTAFMIPATVVWCVWLAGAWTAVPESCRSATPGQAVGFLFIPFFNLYWCFRAMPGLSASLRRALVAHEGPRAGGAGYGLGIAACVVSVIPYVNLLAWPLMVAWTCLANSAKNRLLTIGLRRAHAGPRT